MAYEYNGVGIRPIVEIYHDSIPYYSGITLKEFFWDKKKCADAWRIGSQKITEYFGDLLPPRGVAGPPISYGHLICLGAPVIFPEDSEPNVKPFVKSIDEGIELLKEKQGMDFTKNSLFQHYVEMCDYLQEQFPDKKVPFSGFGSQGPLTSAVLMRGQDFIFDVYDYPEKAQEFLRLLTDSIIDFRRLSNRMNNAPEVSTHGTGLADDFASLIAPDMWPDFVIPFWNQFYEGLTTGRRSLHCENLSPTHLKHLKAVKIDQFQPSVSELLTIENIKANTDIPFDWLLYAFRVTQMSDQEIQQWVDDTVKAGITSIRTQFGQFTVAAGKLDRILAFYKAFEKYKV